ncbi:MAG: hypothetical protein ABWY26_00630 [Microbacterium sp.]
MSNVPAAAAVLDVVDRGRRAPWVERALALAALAGADADVLLDEPVGRLQEAALDLHESVAGDALDALATCPRCGAPVEFTVPVAQLRDLAPAGSTDGSVVAGEFTVQWRAPTVRDLRASAASADAGAELRRRCLAARRGGRGVAVERLPGAVLEEAESAMAAGDPLAEVLIALECPECGADFDADLDPIGFVWTDLEASAERTLREVDELARAYGWTEDEILSLPAARRASYLSIVRGGRP